MAQGMLRRQLHWRKREQSNDASPVMAYRRSKAIGRPAKPTPTLLSFHETCIALRRRRAPNILGSDEDDLPRRIYSK